MQDENLGSGLQVELGLPTVQVLAAASLCLGSLEAPTKGWRFTRAARSFGGDLTYSALHIEKKKTKKKTKQKTTGGGKVAEVSTFVNQKESIEVEVVVVAGRGGGGRGGAAGVVVVVVVVVVLVVGVVVVVVVAAAAAAAAAGSIARVCPLSLSLRSASCHVHAANPSIGQRIHAQTMITSMLPTHPWASASMPKP